MNTLEGEEPISFVTPIHFLLEMKIGSVESELRVMDLVKEGYIPGIFDDPS
jgi:hypothetical protein